MDKIPKSRLELLMKISDTSGKTLSTVLHIDVSLISRWKNGKRKISNIDYLYDITNFFIRLEDYSYLPALKTLLNLPEDSKENDVQEALALWLSLPLHEQDILNAYSLSASSRNDETYIKSYLGNSGRRQSVMEFLTAASGLSGNNMYLISQEDMSWMVEDPAFLKQWAAAMMKCIETGYTIHIIHTIRRSMEELSTAFLQWMPFYMTGKVKAYYLTSGKPSLPYETLFIAENLLLCEGNNHTGKVAERYSVITNDLITIQSRQKDYNTILKTSTKLNSIYQVDQIPKVLDSVVTAGKNKEESLFRSDELFFTTMSRDNLMGILTDNNLSELQTNTIIGSYDRLTANFKQNVTLFTNKHIYNLQSLAKQADSDEYKSNLLTIIAGQDIIITKERYIDHLQTTINRLNSNPYFSIGLYTPKTTVLPLEELSFWVKETYFLTMWSRKSYKDIQVSKEPTMVETIKQFYEQLWNMIPPIDKSKDHVIEHLNKLITIAKN